MALTEWFFEKYMVLNQKNVITCASVEIPTNVKFEFDN